MVMDLDGRMALKRILQKRVSRVWTDRFHSKVPVNCNESSCYSKENFFTNPEYI
jgi:hypothetical protein